MLLLLGWHMGSVAFQRFCGLWRPWEPPVGVVHPPPGSRWGLRATAWQEPFPARGVLPRKVLANFCCANREAIGFICQRARTSPRRRIWGWVKCQPGLQPSPRAAWFTPVHLPPLSFTSVPSTVPGRGTRDASCFVPHPLSRGHPYPRAASPAGRAASLWGTFCSSVLGCHLRGLPPPLCPRVPRTCHSDVCPFPPRPLLRFLEQSSPSRPSSTSALL